MKHVYLYALDTMADWEVGNILAELNSKRFFRQDAPAIELSFVGSTLDMITTMGGMKIMPQITIDEIEIDRETMLILPGADTWQEEQNVRAIEAALQLMQANGCVSAICGATVSLAQAGALDEIAHTSNGPGFLEMFAPNYSGSNFYVDEPAIRTNNVITAGATGSLLWTKYILEHLGVLSDNATESWYQYFSSGSMQHFFSLMSEAKQ